MPRMLRRFEKVSPALISHEGYPIGTCLIKMITVLMYHHNSLPVLLPVVDHLLPGEGGVPAAELSEGVHIAAAVLIDEAVHRELVQSLSGAES